MLRRSRSNFGHCRSSKNGRGQSILCKPFLGCSFNQIKTQLPSCSITCNNPSEARYIHLPHMWVCALHFPEKKKYGICINCTFTIRCYIIFSKGFSFLATFPLKKLLATDDALCVFPEFFSWWIKEFSNLDKVFSFFSPLLRSINWIIYYSSTCFFFFRESATAAVAV